MRFVFEHGRQLADPQRVLRGDGKQVRYIDLRDAADIPTDAVRLLLLEAVALRGG